MVIRFNFSLRFFIPVALVASFLCADAQSFKEQYEQFKKQSLEKYQSFREECNRKYVDFLNNSWKQYNGQAPLPRPNDETPVPPRPFVKKEDKPVVEVKPIAINPVRPVPQPEPVEPVKEVPVPEPNYFTVDYLGLKHKVRLPDRANLKLFDTQPKSIARAWERLSDGCLDNAIHDCLEIRNRLNLCDWAYLQFLKELATRFCNDTNGATFLTAYLYCQSGYQMRLGVDDNKLILLFGSPHQIFDKPYFKIEGANFYPLDVVPRSISICDAPFEGEKPLSLIINQPLCVSENLSPRRNIAADAPGGLAAGSRVPTALIDFFNSYPSSMLANNQMTRWAIYAATPLNSATKDNLYPELKSISELPQLQAVEKLLNWVQTGFVYELDDKVWGHDRAFFAEETLYYPYCDCEDRSILFSRLVRDLVGLDVALIYYPGHLATAVCFNDEVNGDKMVIDGRTFVVCDPTYIGAPVGEQMPGLDYNNVQAIVLD